MKKIFPILAFILTIIYTTASAQDLTVATYNVRNENKGDEKEGNGWKQRYPVIAGIVLFNDFDIFGTQEAFQGQLNDLTKALPGYAYTGVGRDDGKQAGEHSAIFYKTNRFKLLKRGDFWLSTVTDKPNKGWDAALPRICSWGYFQDIPSGKKFWFFNLHMDHVGVEARKESAKLVLKMIKDMTAKDEPVILTGDFNVDQHNESYTLLHDSGVLQDCYELAPIRYVNNGTFNQFDPNLKTDSRIDHIFINSSFSAQRYAVLTDSYRTATAESEKEIKSGNFPKEVSLHKYIARLPSDHFPVVVKMKFAE